MQNETKRIENERKDIAATFQQLDRFSEAHHFNSTMVTVIPLSEKEVTEFTYERKQYVENVTKSLREKQAVLEAGKEKIDQAKRHFYKFCREQISERKLREMATTGIELKLRTKTSYKFNKICSRPSSGLINMPEII